MAENNDLSPGMAQYMEIKKGYPDYLLFYRMGDFYELFFEDAIVASKALDIALTKRGKAFGQDIPMCGVPFHSHESYLAKLIRNGYKVAICEQLEDPAEARKRGSKSVVKRDVVRLVTSGTLTEDSLLDSRRNNYLLCIAKANGIYGFSWLDLSTGVFYTQDISCTGINEVNEVAGMVAKVEPGEILLPDSMLQNPDLFNLFDEYRDKLSILPAARFDYNNSLRKTTDFFDVQTLDSFANFSRPEVIAMGGILDYIENTQKGHMPRIMRPIKIQNSLFMEIDAATRRNLDLLGTTKGASLSSVMDRTVSGAGARMLNARLTAPLLDLDEINQRLDVVEFFCKHPDARNKLRDILSGCPDMERALSRLSISRGGPRDVYSIFITLNSLSNISLTVKSFHPVNENDEMPAAIENILGKLGNYYSLLDLLNQAFGEVKSINDLPLYARDGYFITPGFSPELDAARDMQSNAEEFVSELQARYIKETGVDSLKIKYNNVIGYFIEVNNKFAPQFLSMPEFIHRQSVMNATRFITTELNELENSIRSASERSLAMENGIFDDLVYRIMVLGDDICRTANALAELDIGAAMADLALENNYCRPVLDNSLTFEIREGRHPIVEAALKRSGKGVFVGNDCDLNGDTNLIWLLTGPNMAGKSTFLRQNAVIAIMAQIGAYVPAKSAHIGIVNKIFSRVGASDDLSRGRSTFMVEMVETASILNQADERSFVILDEIGRGTATFDGLSIAWSVVEYLHDVNKCRSLFATHYHELALLADKLHGLTLHCMKIKEFKEDVIFMHEVIEGAADRSYGIHVAKLAGLPKLVISRAQSVLKRLESEDQGRNKQMLRDELPLFAFNNEVAEKDAEPKSSLSAVEERIKDIEPNDLSAREALDIMYELKELMRNKENGN